MRTDRSVSGDMDAAMELAIARGLKNNYRGGEGEALLSSTDERSVGTSTSINMHAASPTHSNLLSPGQITSSTAPKGVPAAQASLLRGHAAGNGDHTSEGEHDLHMTVSPANNAHVQLIQHALLSAVPDEQVAGQATGVGPSASGLLLTPLSSGSTSGGASHSMAHSTALVPNPAVLRGPTLQQQHGAAQASEQVEGRGGGTSVPRSSYVGQAGPSPGPGSGDAAGGLRGPGSAGAGDGEDGSRASGSSRAAQGLLARLAGAGGGGGDGAGSKARRGGSEHEPLLKSA